MSERCGIALRVGALLCVVLAGHGPARLPAQIIKVATLAPDGSVYDLIMEEQKAAWERDTDGRVEVRLYPGGVAGDDPAVVRKMRIGQFQAAVLTFQGLIEIDEAFRVFVLPLFYRSEEELLHVVERLDPVLRERLEAKGFVLLHWGYAGWARLYSRRPIRTVADLRAHKLFLWGGNDRITRIYRAHGLQPVGVAATDVTMAVQTGMIDCIGTPPLVALSLQWFRQLGYQLDTPIAPLVGATVMARTAWEALSEADRAVILRHAERAERRYEREVPVQESRAIAAMEERGLTRTSMNTFRDEWDALAAAMAADFRATLVPADVYDLAVQARDEVRDGRAGH